MGATPSDPPRDALEPACLFTAVVVDDEETVRRGLQTHFDWARFGIRIVADFPDGQKAFAFLEDHPVDLLVTDVRMPRMDGIELSRRVRQRHPRTKILFVSGYDDTEYLREAFKMDAVDYILKSIDLEELAETIGRVTEEMRRENRRDQAFAEMEEKLVQSIPLLQQRSLMLLIREDILNDEITRDRLKYLDIPLKDDVAYCVLVLQIRDIWRAFSCMREHERLMFSLRFRKDALEVLQRHGGQVCFENLLGEFVMLLEAAEEGYEDTLLSASADLQRLVEAQYGMTCRIGISERFTGLHSAHASYEAAVAAIDRRYLLNDALPVSVDKYAEAATARSVRERAAKDVSAALQSGDMAQVRAVMERTYGDLEALPTDDDRQNFLIHLLLLPARVLTNVRAGERGPYESQRKLLERFLYCADIREQKLLLLEVFEQVAALMDSRSETHPNYVVERVRQTIRSRYMEQLSIVTLADEVHLTSTYLCALFKQATGQTINECLTEVRIEKARELLANPRIKLYDVCYQVGYLSPSYFSKLFKKYTKLTPSEFRDAALLSG